MACRWRLRRANLELRKSNVVKTISWRIPNQEKYDLHAKADGVTKRSGIFLLTCCQPGTPPKRGTKVPKYLFTPMTFTSSHAGMVQIDGVSCEPPFYRCFCQKCIESGASRTRGHAELPLSSCSSERENSRRRNSNIEGGM